MVEYHQNRILIILCKKICMTQDSGVGSSFLLDPTPKPHLQKVLPCSHPCHTWDLGSGTRVKWLVSTPMLTNWPQMTWELELGILDPTWTDSKDGYTKNKPFHKFIWHNDITLIFFLREWPNILRNLSMQVIKDMLLGSYHGHSRD